MYISFLALLLAFCFAACAAVERAPKNRYISYAGVRDARLENGAGHGRIPPGCSAYTGR